MTMPMPASTFALAVGHWHQVTSALPSALEKDRTDTVDTDKPGAGCSVWTEPGPACGLGKCSSDVAQNSTLQTVRYFMTFPVLISGETSPDVLT